MGRSSLVLCASSQGLGCLIETLARFRVDVSFVANLALMENGRNGFTAFGIDMAQPDGISCPRTIAERFGCGLPLL